MQIDEMRNIHTSDTGQQGLLPGSVRHMEAGVQQDVSGSKDAQTAAAFFAGDFHSRISTPGYNRNSIEDETLAEEIARKKAGFTDVQTMKQNLSMAVAGFSVEDISGAKEAGYDVDDMEPDQIVTVIDQIKMHLAMGGKDISSMGGLSDSEIEGISGGSANMAHILEQALTAADLPADDAIVSDGVMAMQKARELSGKAAWSDPTSEQIGVSGGDASSSLTPAAMEYLLKNGLEPTIENAYQGTYSQGSMAARGRAGTGLEALDAYTGSAAADVFQMAGGRSSEGALEGNDALLGQVEKLLGEVDLPMDERQRQNAEWMLDKAIPVTGENLAYLNEMQTKEPLLSFDSALKQITASVAEGKRPQEAYVLPGYSLTDKAQEIYDTVQNVTDAQASAVEENGDELTIAALRRQMVGEADGLSAHTQIGVGESRAAGAAEQLTGMASAAEAADQSAGTVSAAGADELLTGAAEQMAVAQSEAQPGDIRALRILEETRLLMTQQANFTLLKQGISLDTMALSEVVDHLKQLETDFYKKTLVSSGEILTEEALHSRIGQFETTTEQLRELEGMPAALLGRIPDVSGARLGTLHREGRILAQVFAQAGERYETMRTEVRRDLGDSMRKAFRNVDDILEDLSLETTESNRRAVRILAYNETEINKESVAGMKGADELVQRVFKSLTPGVVARMIREGENPLDLSMEELHDKAEEFRSMSSADSEEEHFSAFLYKAQANGEISEEERQAFVGVYRLIYQVEKTDGAVIGQLLNQGAQLTLRNMMMAARTRKHENREFTVDDDFGFAEFDKSVLSITDQIEMGFQTARMRDAGDMATPQKLAAIGEETYLEMTPDALAQTLSDIPDTAQEKQEERAYEVQKRQQMLDAVRSEARVCDMLAKYDLPQTPSNLEAFTQFLSDRNSFFRQLLPRRERTTFGREDAGVRDGETGLSDVIDDLIRDFGESVRTPEEMAKAQQKLEDVAENVMKTMIVRQPAEKIDVRGLQVSMKQLRALGQVGERRETYAVPIVVENSVGNMTLKIVRGREEDRGQVDLALDMEATGVVRASFRYEADGVFGTVTADRSATTELLEQAKEELNRTIRDIAGVPVEISVKQDRFAKADRIFEEEPVVTPREDGERPPVQTKVLYGIARSFIDAVGSQYPRPS